ncbi:MAG: LysM peptidoglycan-binding domain-containing protein [Chloroflexi bacterium]|nr:LysM peptidoglycan-binding domain-containing protein [Chloroflexota bacterium]
MRSQLQHALGRPIVLAIVGLGLGGLLAVWLFATYATFPSQLPLGQPTEAPPQVPASAPEPTLAAVEPAIALSPEEASPFAGIAALPPEPPKRTGLVAHTVAPGEVLWQIAEQYNLRAETILWANNLPDPDLLLVGQQLQIPPEDGVVYTVRSGDQLSDIAARYGVDIDAVIKDNGIGDPDTIQAGTDIFLPGGRPLAPTALPDTTAEPGNTEQEQAAAANGPAAALPNNIDALLGAGWLSAQHVADLYKSADSNSSKLHQLPGGAQLERLDGPLNGRIHVRDPGDGRTRQAMTGWVNAFDLDVGRAPATRQLPLAYPADTAMDISHVFAPYRSQLDGSPYAEANCGPTAAGMAMEAFGVSVPPPQVRQQALAAQHMSGNGVGTLITALAQVVEQNGLSAVDLRDTGGGLTHWSLDQIRAHIQAGHPIVVQVRYRSLPGRGGAYYFGDHYILVTGVVGDGFLYNDPIDVDGLGWDRVISGATLQNAMNASASQYAYSAFAVSR